MSIVEKIRGLLSRKDALEWDASDPAGDESAYKKDYVAVTPYNHKKFVKGEEKDGN